MKRLLLLILVLISLSVAAQQKIENLDKLTVPLVKIPNATVAPSPSTSMMYAIGNHLYWGPNRLDTVGGSTDTAGWHIAPKSWVSLYFQTKGTFLNVSDTGVFVMSRDRAASTFEPKIGIGTTNQYWRGDKSWQTIAVPASTWTVSGNNQYSAVSGNVGIGTTDMNAKLTVTSTDTNSIYAINTNENNGHNTITGISNSTGGGEGAGVYGESNYGYGVRGVNTIADGGTGILGEAIGLNGTGVRGTGTTYGVYGESKANYGGFFNVTNAYNTGTGVYGNGGNYGGNFVSTDGYGLYAGSTNGYGVSGVSTTSTGVSGSSTSSYGGTFSSTSGIALMATSYGIAGQFVGKVKIDTIPTQVTAPSTVLTDSLGIIKRYPFPAVSPSDTNLWVHSGNKLYPKLSTDSVGIGKVPTAKLDVNGDALINGVTVGKGKSSYNGNTAMGVSALKSNTTGQHNTGIGAWSLYSVSTGLQNTAIGSNSLYYNNGDANTAIGAYSLTQNSSGLKNTATGAGALRNTTGNNNTGNGCSSLYNNTTGYSNTAVGVSALYSNTIRGNLVAIGDSVLYKINGTTLDNGKWNTAIGSKAMYNATTVRGSTAVGYNALYSCTSSGYNTAIGYQSLYSITTGSSNTAVGTASISQESTGSYNVGLGTYALSGIVGKSGNTAIGYSALQNMNGSHNVAIGDSSGNYNAGLSNRLFIASLDSTTHGIYGDMTTGKDWYRINGTWMIKTIPTGSSSDSIMVSNSGLQKKILNSSTNWNTAYSWGNHASAGYLVNPMSTVGDMIYMDNTPTANRVPIGAENQYLSVKKHSVSLPGIDYYVPEWKTPDWWAKSDTTATLETKAYNDSKLALKASVSSLTAKQDSNKTAFYVPLSGGKLLARYNYNMGIGSALAPQHTLAVVKAAAGINIVDPNYNKVRTADSNAATDTSSICQQIVKGNPKIDAKNRKGVSVFSLDTLGRVKSNVFYTENDYQGLAWNENTDQYVRLGTLAGKALSATPGDQLMPVQSGMRGCVMQDNGVVNYYLFPADWTYKDDLSAATLTGADGQVMVEIPKFYFKYAYTNGWHIWKISKYPLTGFTVHPVFTPTGTENDYTYIGAYEGSLYNVASSIYANGLYQPAHSAGFTSATKTIAKLAGSALTIAVSAGGTGYAVGNVLTITGGTLAATCTVSTVSAGVVTAVTLTTKGYGLTTGVKATTGGAGTGCTINVSVLEDMTNCYTNLAVGDKVVVSGTVSNNGTFTVASIGNTSFTVSEAVTDETYALNCVIQTKVVTTATTGDKLCSVSGKVPVVYQTRASFRNISANRGSNWHQLGYDQVDAVELLGLIEYGTFYWQNIAEIGPGITNVGDWPAYNNDNPFVPTGNGNVYGNYSADNAGAATCAGDKAKINKYRGIENFYGHIYKWVDGINVNNNRAYVASNYTTWADDTSTGYTDLGADIANANGYQEHLINSSRAILPSTVGGSGSGSARITDYYYQSTGWRVGSFGGFAGSSSGAGGFCWFLGYGSGTVYQYFGGRLSFK